MKRILKILGVVVVVVVLLVAVTAVALPLVVDPNAHKDRIVALAKEHTGRDLRIDGNIGLSVFPWLGVSLEQAQLGNAPGFENPVFASLDEMKIRVKLLPLLSRRIEMDTVTVRGLKLNLARDANGHTNWADLAAGKPGDAESKPDKGTDGTALAALAIGGLDIRDAAVSWHDAQSGQQLGVDKLAVTTGALGPNKPVDLSIEFDLDSGALDVAGHVITNARVSLDLARQVYRAEGLIIRADLKGGAIPGGKATVQGAGSATFDAASQRVSVSGFKLDSSPLALPDHSAKLSVAGEITGDLAAQVFEASGLKLEARLEGKTSPKDRVVATATTELRADLAAQTLAARDLVVDVPELNLAGTSGKLKTSGNLSANLASRSYALKGLSGGGALGGNALGGRSLDFALAGSAGGSLESNRHKVEGLRLTGHLSGADLPGGRVPVSLAGNADFDGTAQVLTATELKFSGAGLSGGGTLSARDLKTQPTVEGQIALAPFSPRELLKTLGQNPPATADSKALASAELAATFTASAERAELKPLTLVLDGSRITGTARVQNFAKPAIGFDLKADALDLDRYLPPAPAAKPAQKAKSNTAGGAATPGAAAAAATGLPLAELRALDLDGQLQVGKLKASGLNLTQVQLGLKAKNGLIGVTPLKAQLYGGSYAGQIALDARGDKATVSVDEKISGVKLSSLLADLGVKPGGTDLSGASDLALRAQASGDPNTQVYRIDGMALQASLGGKSFPNGKLAFRAGGDVDLDLAKQQLASQNLTLGIADMQVNTRVQVTGLLGNPRYEGTLSAARFNPRRVLEQLGQVIETADPKALASAEFATTVAGDASSVRFEPLTLTLDDTQLKGALTVTNFAKPANRFDLQIDNLDADRYLPPPAKGKKAPAATPGAALAVLPVETLRGIDVDGQLRIDRLKISNLKLTNIRLTAKGKDGVVGLHPLTAELYQGTYTGNVQVDARGKQPRLNLDEQLRGIQAGPMLQDLQGRQPVTGLANATFKLTAIGEHADAITQSLDGQALFEFSNGTVQGIDMLGQVCSALAATSVKSFRKQDLVSGLLQLAVPPPTRADGGAGGTPFSDLRGTVLFKNGVARNDDLVLKSPVMQVTGRGQMRLSDLVVNYQAVAELAAGCAERVGRSFRELRRYQIPVNITGPADNLQVQANFTAGLLQALQGGQPATTQQPQTQALPIPLPPASPVGTAPTPSPAPGQAPPPPAKAEPKPQPPPSEKEILRDVLKGLLKKQ